MCGIAGYFIRDCEPGQSNGRMQRCISLLHHRGPDDKGIDVEYVCGGELTLAQTRLAIIDLSPAGHQPMCSIDGRYKIVFNGEIYNYKELRSTLQFLGRSFLTETDTEVLLSAWEQWGSDCLQKLRGMFAFVVYDKVKRTLHCARDPFGIKPFYLGYSDNSFFFASEVRALISLMTRKPKINVDRTYKYLLKGLHDDDESTFYTEIFQLKPGHHATVSLDREICFEPIKWWRPKLSEATGISIDNAASNLRDKFLESVRIHLRSDVPLGAALSGGLDSSSVVCAIRYLDPAFKINTFSYVARGSCVDEEKWIDTINCYVNAVPHKVLVQETEIARDIDDFIATQGEPVSGLSYYIEYRVYQLAKEHGIKVMLDGHGADECLGGYIGYPAQRIKSLFDRREYLRAVVFALTWGKWPGRSYGLALKYLLRGGWSSAVGRDPRYAYSKDFGLLGINKKLERSLFNNPSEIAAYGGGGNFSVILARSLVAELDRELSVANCPPQLRSADRSAMRRTIENRVPFLNPDVVEYALSLPENYIVSDNGLTKHVFRRAMRGIVPKEILERRDKIGYAAAPGQFLDGGEGLLRSLERSCERFPFLNKKGVMSLITKKGTSLISLDGDAWRIVNLLKWAEMYDVSCSE